MDYNKDVIRQKLMPYWKDNWHLLSFKLNGKDVQPEAVSSMTIQLEEGDYGDGYNFHCIGLNLRVTINGVDKPYKAEFTIKVIPQMDSGSNKPTEIIDGVQNNMVLLRC